MNIYQELGVETIINAAGSMTDLGGSIMDPETTNAMIAASRYFVDIPELHQAAGRRIAELVGVEAVHVCLCASAGITLMAAACMTGTDPIKASRLPDTSGMKNRFVVHQAHRNPFDHAVHIAGGEFSEISSDLGELKAALTDEVAAVYYTYAWFCVGEALPLKQVTQVAHRVGVPVIVDAAAQVPPVENLSQFIENGADLVAFSGGKAIQGPQSSGLILGRKDLVDACTINDSPNVASIGRGMKAAKEEIVGLVKAIELYVQKDHAAEMRIWEERVSHIISVLSEIDGITLRRELPPGIGSLIPFVSVTWDEKMLGVTLQEVVRQLREGVPRIAIKLVDEQTPGVKHPQLWIRVHTLQEGEETVVARRIKELLSERRLP